MATHPAQNSILSANANMMGQNTILSNNTNAAQLPWFTGTISSGMSSDRTYAYNRNQVYFTVEKVDNGFILKGSRNEGDIAKVKICKDMDELKDLFVSTLVEYQLEK